jgi:murein DD-endopeptidase MepM/ murein hydrolase activator NlpD
MRITILLAMTLVTSSIAGQTEQDYATAIESFKVQYNAQAYGEIYTSYATDMQQALSAASSKTFFSNTFDSFGELEAVSALGMEGPFHRYHGVFAEGDLFIDLSLNADRKINGIALRPYVATTPVEDLVAPMAFEWPSEGEWYVFWGGDTKEQNYHIDSKTQRAALDLVVVDGDGKSHQADGKLNSDYYAFGKKVVAPAAGKVVFAVDGIPDNVPGEMNPMFVPGNSVLLDVGNDAYVLIAHLREGSVAVSKGDKVVAGDLLGQCGNSGNSSEAHIHMHAQKGLDMTNSEGLKMVFAALEVNGTTVENHSPVKGERVSNP